MAWRGAVGRLGRASEGRGEGEANPLREGGRESPLCARVPSMRCTPPPHAPVFPHAHAPVCVLAMLSQEV
jgi:hypothetical protein